MIWRIWWALRWRLWTPWCKLFGHKWRGGRQMTDYGTGWEYYVEGCRRCLCDYDVER